MAWAMDQTTQEPVYIGSLPRSRKGLACGCICPACKGVLQAVNAGMPKEHFDKPGAQRPSFRHDKGQQQDGCRLKIARLAALHLLIKSREIDLPARSVFRPRQGSSGKFYEGQAEVSPARVRVRHLSWVDEHAARLTLDDGRVLRIQLSGRMHTGSDDPNEAVITISVDDPEVSTWSAEDILSRVRLDGDWMCWQRHWDDQALAEQAEEDALAKARADLDAPPQGLELPDGLLPYQQSETLLHWYVQNLLVGSAEIRTPELSRDVNMTMPDGRLVSKTVTIPAMTLKLSDVRSQYDMGNIVPDLWARARDVHKRLPVFDLLIEVAVTHKVDEVKAAKIIARDVACIELDVSLLAVGGRQSIDRLREMVVGDPGNKRWIHHPALRPLIEKAQDALEHQAASELEARVRAEQVQRDFDESSDHDALALYLARKREIWLTGRDVPAELSTSKVVAGLSDRGFRHLEGPEFSGPTGVLRTLEGIRNDAARGVTSTNATIALRRMEEEEAHHKFASLYLLAIKHYAPRLSAQATERLAALRARVKHSLEQEELTFARPVTWDSAISVLFPELAAGIATRAGTAELVESRRRARVQAERRAAEEATRLAREAAEREAREKQELSLKSETDALIQSTARQFKWAALNDGPPLNVESAIILAQRNHAYSGLTDWVRTTVESAWQARQAGQPILDWLRSWAPEHGGSVIELRNLLERAWLIEKA